MAKEIASNNADIQGGEASSGGGAGGMPSRLLNIFKQTDILFAIGIIGILIVLLIPIPTFFLDTLLGLSITFSVLILMTVLFINRALEFSAFPTVLLVAAMFRLSLNIASTRLILSNGHEGPAAAGHVIEAFGGFVMAGSVVIGVIVFGILTIINFVVITKGSGRIAEVAARFSLDAMPGKQMAIDADLSAGLIDEEMAKTRRKTLEDESTFYGAMDGASKFVRGDAIAGLLITFINFIGGMVIGVVQRDLSFQDALQSYTMLTIGDGLVSQIPALIVSTAAGMLVSKAGTVGSTDKAIFAQMGRSSQALAIVSALIFLMGFMPAIPMIPFFSIAGGVGYLAWKKYQKEALAEKEQEEFTSATGQKGVKAAVSSGGKQATVGAGEGTEEEDPVSAALKIDVIRLELGYGLLPLINYEKGNKLPDQIKALRKQLARDMGFVLPSVRIQDNMQLKTHEYVVRIKDIECARGEVKPNMLLAMDPKGAAIMLPGEDTREPAFGLPAKWIPETAKEDALFKDYTVVDPPTVITTHVTEVVKENVVELLSFAETKKLLDGLEGGHKKLYEETVPDKMTIGGIQRILLNLLSERISIRDLSTILEAIAEISSIVKSITLITEHVRMRLARQISYEHIGPEGHVPILVLSPAWEQAFSEGLIGEEDPQLSLPPSKLQEFIGDVKKAFQKQMVRGENPVLLVSPRIRPYVRSVIERFRPSTVVMSQNEVHPKVRIKTLGQV